MVIPSFRRAGDAYSRGEGRDALRPEPRARCVRALSVAKDDDAYLRRWQAVVSQRAVRFWAVGRRLTLAALFLCVVCCRRRAGVWPAAHVVQNPPASPVTPLVAVAVAKPVPPSPPQLPPAAQPQPPRDNGAAAAQAGPSEDFPPPPSNGVVPTPEAQAAAAAAEAARLSRLSDASTGGVTLEEAHSVTGPGAGRENGKGAPAVPVVAAAALATISGTPPKAPVTAGNAHGFWEEAGAGKQQGEEGTAASVDAPGGVVVVAAGEQAAGGAPPHESTSSAAAASP